MRKSKKRASKVLLCRGSRRETAETCGTAMLPRQREAALVNTERTNCNCLLSKKWGHAREGIAGDTGL